MTARRPGLVRALATAVVAVLGMALSACVDGPGPDTPIRVGWVGDLPPLDPAGVDGPAAFALLAQLHPSLLSIVEGEPAPDVAESAAFTADGEYTVVLKPGLTFANGGDLTSSDVVFSIERLLALQDDAGPWRELDNLDEVEAVDDTTVVFRLRTAQDAGFPFVLAGLAGLVLDEESFFADELTPDEAILSAEAFGGPFSMARSDRGDITLTPFPDYGGLRPAKSVIELSEGEAGDLANRLVDGGLDVLTGRPEAATIDELAEAESISLTRAASGRLRLLVFDLDLMPFGSGTDSPDPAKAAAVRFALADLVDRQGLVAAAGSNLLAPAFGYVPAGVAGAASPIQSLTGDGDGGPDPDRAAVRLNGAGVTEPVALVIHVAPGLIGGPVAEELAALKLQVEVSGRFRVEYIETDAAGIDEAGSEGALAIWFTSVASTTLDPQAYLKPYQTGREFALGFSDEKVDQLLAQQRTQIDPEARLATLHALQSAIAAALPAIPITQGVRVVFADPSISGADVQDAMPLDLSALGR